MTSSLPRHVAIIMDGNGRWAQKRHRPRVIGHRAGAKALSRSIDFCLTRGIAALTVFAFSSENWGRPTEEVNGLMKLFLSALDREVADLNKRGVRLRFIGQRQRFASDLQERMDAAEALTGNNSDLQLAIAVNYGGRQDIVDAAQSVARAVAAGQLDVDSIDESTLAQHMALSDLPPPDLFIRTGGDVRISNFLLWQLAYAELWFSPVLWPDFGEVHFEQALSDFIHRERRFGLTSAQVAPPPVESP